MFGTGIKWTAPAAVAAGLLAGGLAAAANNSQHQRVDGMDVYYGVVPAAVAQGRHPAGHPEAALPNGYASGSYHLVVALKDRHSGRPITDARVAASVGRGFASRREVRPLMPMTVHHTVSYGNYFAMGRPGTYHVHVFIQRPGMRRVRTVTFAYQQH